MRSKNWKIALISFFATFCMAAPIAIANVTPANENISVEAEERAVSNACTIIVYHANGGVAMTFGGSASDEGVLDLNKWLNNAYGLDPETWGIVTPPSYEVVLGQDVVLKEAVTIAADKKVTIDLNGYTMSSPYQTGSTTNHVYPFENYGVLTIEDGSANADGVLSGRGIKNYGTMTLNSGMIDACDANGGYAVYNSSGTFTMNGGAVVASNEDGDAPGAGYDATTIGNMEGATATINGGIVNNKSNFTFALDNQGTMEVNGGTFTSIHTTVSNSGTLTIDGGSFTCNGLEGVTAHVVYAQNGSTTVIKDGTFDGKDNYNGFNVYVEKTADVTVNGGTYLNVHSGTFYDSTTTGAPVVNGGNFFDKIPAKYLADGLILEERNGAFNVERGLQGTGTEADPYVVANEEDFLLFRDSVNSGATKYNAPGVWVVLGANIDLAGTTWARGIGDGINATFDGNFNGKGYTISNLNMAVEADSDGYLCGGLFGYTYGGVTITNLVLENVTITSADAGHNVGILVGFANNNGGKANISDITIKGDIVVNTPNVYGVGAIVGYSYRAMGTIDNCKVIGNAGSYITGYSFVGGITGYSYENAIISNSSVSNVAITATKYSVGGIVGLALSNNVVSGCTVTNTTVSGQANVGSVVGAISAATVVVENTTSTVNAPVVGGNYADNGSIGGMYNDVYYLDFFAALDAAIAAGNGEVVAMSDVTALVEINQVAGQQITINGNGYKFTQGIKITTTSSITDGKRLTIKNVKFENTEAGASVDFISSTETNHYPILTIENCSFVGADNDDVAVRIKSASDTIIKDCTGSGLHSFLQNTAGWNLTIENVEVTNSKSGFALGSVQGATLSDITADVTNYGVRVDAQYDATLTFEDMNVKAFIPVVVRKASADVTLVFDGNNTVNANNTDGKWLAIGTSEYEENGEMPTASTGKVGVALEDANLSVDGVYGMYVEAQVGEKFYASFETALAAMNAGDTITLVRNITLTEEVELPAGIIFNGNGFAINGTIYAGGDLTFAGYTKVTAFSASYYNRVITIGAGATLEITGTGRVTLGYGNTFNITGTIDNAKSANKADVTPSLIIPGGMSITGGNDATMNVTNAYVKIGSTTSKNSVANGTFTMNFTNSIAEFTNQLTLAEPTSGKNPTFNINVKDSVLTTGTKFVVAAPNSNVVIDNSIVTMATYFRNSGNMEIKNGSVVTGSTIQFGENGGNNGTTIVDGSEFTITAGGAGHALDGKNTGKVVLQNNATASLDYVTNMTIDMDVTSMLNITGAVADTEIIVDVTGAANFGATAIITSANSSAIANIVKGSAGVNVEVIGNEVYVSKFVAATVNGVEYASLQEAVNVGGEVVLFDNVVNEQIVIAKGQEVTLDLNGYTMSANITEKLTKSYALITNKGTLTVKNGTVSVNYSGASFGYGVGLYAISNEGGELNVESGRIENNATVSGSMYDAIDNNSTLGDTVTNIMGGEVYCAYIAIRQFSNGNKNVVNVTGGTIIGGNTAIWTQNPGSGTPNANIAITDGMINGRILLGESANFDVEISGGTFTVAPQENWCAEGLIPAENADGTFGLVQGLKGAGTEANPYIINNVSDLEFFRASVNSGETKYNAPGVWVALGANIDLAGTTWARGIGDGINATFDGNFNGNDYTISNLNMAVEADNDGYLCGGLFGYTYGGVTIKNLVLENVTITSADAGHNVGILVGFANNNGGKANISDITIKGDIVVNTPNAYGVGAIVGYSYRAMGTIDNCQVIGNAGSYITGYSFVGGITGYSYENAIISNSSVSNVAIKATSSYAGGIAGLVLNNNVISGCKVTDVTVSATQNAGSVVGALGSMMAIVENTTSNVNAPVVGGNYGDNSVVQAAVGNTYYADFATAFAAAQAGDTVQLFVDLELAEILTIDKAITLNGNGNTITSTANRAINVDVAGEVTIMNLEIVGGAGCERGINIINKVSTTNIDNVIVSGISHYAVHVATSAGAVTVNVTDSNLTGYGAIAVYGVGSIVNVTDSDLIGINSYADNGSNSFSTIAVASNVTVNVNGGTIVAQAGADNDSQAIIGAQEEVTGATYVIKDAVLSVIGENAQYLGMKLANNNVSMPIAYADALNAEGYAVVVDGGFAKVYKAVAMVGDVYYATFEEAAQNIATDGSDTVIKLFTDVEVVNNIDFNYGTGDVIFTADKPVTIKQTKIADYGFVIANDMKIYVDENVTFEIYDNNSGFYVYYGPSMVIEGAIKGGANWGCLYLFNGEHVVTETGSVDVGRVQLGFTSMTVEGSLKTNYLLVEGGEFVAENATVNVGAIHDSNNGGMRWGASNFTFVNTPVTANTVTLGYADSTLKLDLNSALTANKFSGAGKIIIDATSFAGNTVQVIKADMSAFTGTIEILGDDVVFVKSADGIIVKTPTLKIGDRSYATVQSALEAVQEGETIVLYEDVVITEAAYGQNALNYNRAASFTFDLNGHTIEANTGNSVFRFNNTDSGATQDVVVTMKNGTVVSGANTWCAVMAAGTEEAKAIFNLENLTINNSRAGDLGVKAWDNAIINATNVTINATNGAGGFYAVGGEIVLNNCTVNQSGLHTAPYLSMAIAVSGGGKATVNSGSYVAAPTSAAEGNNQGTSHGSWVAGVMNSGGTLVINGGTFANGNYGEDSLATAARGLIMVDTYGKLEINGGTFNALKKIVDETNNLGIAAGNPVVSIKGGDFSADPTVSNYGLAKLVDGYVVVENNGRYQVVLATAKVNDTYYATFEDALKALTADATLTLMQDVTIDYAWDNRYTGAKVTVPVTIDGNGYTIKFKNTINDGYNFLSAFRFEANATVKNLTIDMSEAISVFAGRLRAISAKADLTVDNCTFIGTTAYSNTRAIIFGEGAGAATANVNVVITNSEFVNWTKAISDNENAQDVNNVTITDNAFENANVNVSATTNVTFTGNEVTGAGVVITSYANATNVVVTATNNVLDATASNSIQTNPANVTADSEFATMVANVGNKYYATFEAAVAKANNATVVLLEDVVVDSFVTIAKDNVVAIDLNGYTISGVDTTSKNFGLIQNNGTLTINDTEGTGAIVLEATTNSGWNRYSAVISNNPGATLVVNGGTIEHKGGTDMAYGIDSLTNGSIGNVSVTINGGTVKSTYRAIRQFLNSATAENVLTINGGTIEGANKAVFFHDPSTKANKGTITIAANATVVGGTYLYVTAGSTEWPVSVSIASGEVIPANVPEKYVVVNNNGVYGVQASVAVIDGVGYATFADALAAAQDGDTVVVLANVELPATTNVRKSITIDGNGYTFTQVAGVATNNHAFFYVDNNSNFTMKNATFDGVQGSVIRSVGANVTIDNCVFENGTHTGNQGIVRLNIGSAVIKNSTFKNNVGTMVLSFNYDAGNATDTLVVEGCTFENNTAKETAILYYVTGASATITNNKFIGNTMNSSGNAATIYLGFTENNTVTGNLFENNTVTITGTSVRGAGAIFFGYEMKAFSGNAFVNNSATNANGDELGQVCVSTYYDCDINVSGNYWGGEAPEYGKDYTLNHQTGAANFVLDSYYTTYAVVDGEVVMGNKVSYNYVAKVGKFSYETLAEAFAAAVNGDVITLLNDVVIDSETYTIADGVAVTLDMNGKTITVTDNKTANYELFYIYGEMTVTGNGTITLTATNNRAWNAMSAIFHNRGGELTIENGTFTHNGGTDMAYVIDNSANWYGDVVTNVNGGELTSTYTAIRNRMEQNTHGASGKATLNITGGTIYGTTSAIWAQAASTSTVAPATGAINVSGGEINIINTARSNGAVSMTTISGGKVEAFKGEIGELKVTGGELGTATMMTAAGEAVEFAVTADGVYVAAQAKIGNETYVTLADALAAAQVNGETVTLLANVSLEGYLTVAKGNVVAIDLNGYTISGVDTTSKNFGLIQNNGTLTINDTVGTGAIVLEATINSGWGRYSAVISNNPGATLVVNGGTIEHLGGTDMAYGIDSLTNGSIGNVSVTINGGTVKSTYRAIRQFLNSATAENVLTINGGTIEGANKAIFFHDPSTKANKGEITIAAQATVVGGTYLFVTAGSTEWPVSVSIASGEVIPANVPEKYVVVNNNGVYGVQASVAAVDGVGYATLAEAIAAANGNTVKLAQNIEMSESLVIAAGVTAVIDLNGYTISGVDTTSKNFGLIQNNGTLTINDSVGTGAIVLEATTNSGWNRYSAVVSNNPGGTLVVNGGTLEHKGGTDMAYGIDSLTNGTIGNVSVTINGGTVKSTYRAIRQFLNSATAENVLTINGGTIEGANKAIFFHDPSTKANKGTITIAAQATVVGGTYLFVTAGSTEWPVSVSIASGEVITANVPEQYAVVESNGVYGIQASVAAVSGVGYATLEEAFAAAVNGDEVIIYQAGTYNLGVSGKDITITGAVEGVVFANIGAKNMAGANVVFNNVTFDYAMNSTYKGLQHSGKLTYNDCTFNGQVFLYGVEETFNNCTFNQTMSANYNVWTYGAKKVTFNECTFNSAGKSVLIYAESASVANEVVINNSEFIASEAVEGKAAIELDTSLTSGANLEINNTTATGFANGNVSGNSLWNNKKGNNETKNNDIVIVVDDVTVLAPITYKANVNGKFYYATLAEAVAVAQDGDTITLLGDVADEAIVIAKGMAITLDLNGYTMSANITEKLTKSYALITNKGTLTVKNGTISVNYSGASFGYGVGLYAISNEGGELNVESGRIENNATVSGSMYDAIDNNSTLGDTVTNIMGGEVYCAYIAIRQFSNGNKNVVNVMGGTIEGGNTAIWTQNPGSGTPNANIAITDGMINGRILLGESANFDVEISGGTFTVEVPEAWCADGFIPVKNSDGTYLVRAGEFVARINGVGYVTLQEAINACGNGTTTIEIAVSELNENVTILQNKSKSIVINGNGVTYTGTITVNGNKRNTGAETLTIKNFNFVADTNGQVFVTVVENSYAHNVTIMDSTMDGKNYNAYGVTLRQAYNITLKNVEATNMLDVVYAPKSVIGFTADDVTITNSNGGILLGHTATGVVIKNVTMDVSGCGIYVSNNTSGKTIIENCDITAGEPVVMNAAVNVQYTLEIGEGNTFTATNNGDVIKVAGSKEASANVNFTMAENSGVDLADTCAVAIVDGAYYGSMQAAINAANDKVVKIAQDVTITDEVQTVESIKVLYAITGGKNVTIDLNGKQVTINPIYTDAGYFNSIFSVFNGKLTMTDSVGGGKLFVDFEALAYLFRTAGNGELVVEKGYYETDIIATGAIFFAEESDTITVNGGTFNHVNTGWIFNTKGNGTAFINVLGGTYNRTPFENTSKEGRVPYNKAVIVNADGWYEVVDAVAYIVSVNAETEMPGYATIEEAVAAATAGETVKLLTNVELSEILVIDKAITLDGNGNTITSTATRAINVDCAEVVTIKNLTIVGNGACERGINIIQKAGTTNLDNVTISGISHYAVNLASSAGAATVNVTNSELTGYGAISATSEGAIVNVTNSVLVGINSYPDNGSNSFSTIFAVNGVTVTVNGGSISAISESGKAAQAIVGANDGTTGVTFVISGAELIVSGDKAGYVGMKVAGNSVSVPANYASALNDEGYAVIVEGDLAKVYVAVVKVGTTNYATLAEAFAAAVDGDEIIAIKDITVEETIVNTKEVIFNLNGKVVSRVQSATVSANDALIVNKGNLTITDTTGEGKLVYTYAGNKVALSVSTISNQVGGTLTVEAGTIENATAANNGSYAYAIDSLTNGNGGEVMVVVEGGKVVSNYMAIRQFINSTTNNNTLIVNGGEIVGGARAINIHNLKNDTAVTTINDGTISGGTYSVCAITESANVVINGGNFEGTVYYGGEGFIYGGTFDAVQYNGYLAEGMAFKKNGNVYNVVNSYVYGANLTIGVDLSVNFYLAGNYEVAPEMTIVMQANDLYKFTGRTVTLTGEWVERDGMWLLMYTFAGVGPHLMGDNIAASVVVDGETVTFDYSIAEYAYAEFANAENLGYTAEQVAVYRTFFVNLLNYGADSQRYAANKNKNTVPAEDLVNVDMTDEHLAYVTHYHAVTPNAPADVKPTQEEGYLFGKAPTFGAKNGIQIVMQYKDADGNIDNSVFDDWTVRVWGNGHRGTVLKPVYYSKNYYVVEITGILATEFNINYDFMMYDASEPDVEYAISYSIQSYVKAKQDEVDAEGKPTILAGLVKSLWNYGHAASDYIDTFYNY